MTRRHPYFKLNLDEVYICVGTARLRLSDNLTEADVHCYTYTTLKCQNIVVAEKPNFGHFCLFARF